VDPYKRYHRRFLSGFGFNVPNDGKKSLKLRREGGLPAEQLSGSGMMKFQTTGMQERPL